MGIAIRPMMLTPRLLIGSFFALVGGCADPPPKQNEPSQAEALAYAPCRSRVAGGIDSAHASERAGTAFLAAEPAKYEAKYVGKFTDLGHVVDVIRLPSTAGAMAFGGGGLVWVGARDGCVIVLEKYE
jgi:hypothetical protein